jgi:hypothetical protein
MEILIKIPSLMSLSISAPVWDRLKRTRAVPHLFSNQAATTAQGLGADLFRLMSMATIPNEDLIPIAAQLK